MRLSVLLAVLLLAGCGIDWVHSNKSAADMQRDSDDCDLQVNPLQQLSARMHDACMRSRGWKEAPPWRERPM